MSVVILPVLQATVTSGFVALAGLAALRVRRSGAPGWWAAGAFGSLALALCGFWAPGWFDLEAPWLADGLWVLLLAFPYLLLRFTATFQPMSGPLELASAVATALAAAVLASMLIVEGDPWSGSLGLVTILVYWTGVALLASARLWQAGHGEPGVARRRMRWMSSATGVLTLALVSALGLGEVSESAEFLALVLALPAVMAFGTGFAPPRSLRLAWRQTEDEHLQKVTAALLRAGTADEVMRDVLRATSAILGARAAAVIDADGIVSMVHGDRPAVGDGPRDGPPSLVRTSAPLGPGNGELVAWTTPYTAYFGPEEVAMLHTLGAIGGLALERCHLEAEDRLQRQALEIARHESDRARSAAEQARRDADAANLAKSEFLSRMSHELRTPLNAILGFAQLLETSHLAQDDEAGVAYILKAGRHLLALINDVLDLSRIEAGSLTISPEPVHLGELVADSIALVRPLATTRGIHIEVDIADPDAYVLTDRQRCRQVMLNLLSNAVKYNHDHGMVEVSCGPAEDNRFRISVRDTGRGIDPDRRDRLFEPFERLGAESSTVEGTGLGLALTKQLLERLGGDIAVESSLDVGSVFSIRLPVAAPPTETHQDVAHPDTDGAPSGDRLLLLVEDNLANLRVVEAMLRRRPGISVMPAMQGTLALELAYEHRPDAIVLDLHLPDLPGRDVLNRLKADPRTRDIPVIVASADASPGRVRQLEADGAFSYITKPLDLHVFLDTIDRAMQSR